MQTNCNNIQIVGFPRGFSSTGCLFLWDLVANEATVVGAKWAHEPLPLVITTDEMEMAHLRMNVLEQHFHSNDSPPPQMRLQPSSLAH
jgi:hypothetical protein